MSLTTAHVQLTVHTYNEPGTGNIDGSFLTPITTVGSKVHYLAGIIEPNKILVIKGPVESAEREILSNDDFDRTYIPARGHSDMNIPPHMHVCQLRMALRSSVETDYFY